MPCEHYTYEEERALARRRADKVENELDLATRLLCEMCKAADKKSLSPELKKWWNKHKKMDRARLKAEEAERQRIEEEKERDRKIHAALEKLTEEEQTLILGMDPDEWVPPRR